MPNVSTDSLSPETSADAPPRFVPIRRDSQPADGTPVVVGFGGPVSNELPPTHTRDLLEQYTWVVDHVVSRIPLSLMAVANLDKEDLRQEGLIGLLSAAQHFDRSRSARFSPFARTVVSNAVYGALRHHDPLPESTRRDLRTLSRYSDEHLGKFRHSPSEEELSCGSGLTVARIRGIRAMAATVNAVQASASDEEDGFDPTAAPISERTDEASLVQELVKAWECLDERDRRILWARTVNERTVRQVALDEGLSVGRISQIQKSAVTRLRALLLTAGSAGFSWFVVTVEEITVVAEHLL